MTDFNTDENKKKPDQEEIQEPQGVQEDIASSSTVQDGCGKPSDEPSVSSSEHGFPLPDPRAYGWQAPPLPPTQPMPPQPRYQPPYSPYQGYNNQPPYQGYYYPPNPGNSGSYPPPPYQPASPGFYGNTAPRPKMSAGLKAFLIGIGVLIAVLLIALIVFGSGSGAPIQLPAYEGNSSSQATDPGSSSESIDENDNTDDTFSYTIVPNTEGIQIEELPTGDEKSAKEIYAAVSNSVVGVTATKEGVSGVSQGSGIVATDDGYIITNSHVVLNSRSSEVTVTMSNEAEYKAVVVGCDKTTDLAVLKIVDTDDTFIPAVFGDSNSLAVGDWVLAIGNPGGSEYASSLTRGIVSAINRKVGSNSENGMTYIQTDAAINPGNSGGALMNMYGQVVGINSSKIVATGYEGMGFSIPISKAKEIIDELMANGYVQGRTRIGITGNDVDAYTSAYQGIPQGFMIQSIDENESAFTGTEARPGDIIIAIEGVTVTCLKDISNELSVYAPGDQITVTLYRPETYMQGGSSFDVVITLLEDKGETQE